MSSVLNSSTRQPSVPAEANRQQLIAAYQRCELDMSSLIVQLDALQEKDIKGKGVIYTPVTVVQKLIEISQVTPFDTILEPSCGHGAFIFGLLDHAKRAWGLSGKALLTWFTTKVTAVDISETAVAELRELLTAYFALEHQYTTEAKFHNVFVADTLFHAFPQRFNLCIGNPPYVRTQNLDEPYLSEVRARYTTCAKGNVDLYYAFIEMAGEVAARVAFITPNSFLSNASAKKLRALMEPRLTTLIDFKEKLVFPDARTYTCIFSLGAESATYSYSNDFDAPLELRAKETAGAAHDNGATVLSGLATLCDAAFRVQKVGKAFFASHDGLQFEIEEDLVVPYFKLTKHRPTSVVDSFMIYPYREDKSVIPEGELKRLYPKAYKYLLEVKPRLLMRDRGATDGYEAWYAYGRKQGLHAITAREVLVIPQMVGQSCQPFTLNIGRLVSRYGTVVFSAGYLVPVEPNNKELIEFVLDSSRFRVYLVANGKPWPGKTEPYYSLTAKQLRQINFQIEG